MKLHRSFSRRNQGFSLVELAVVIVIVGVLAAFGVPRYRDSVERTKAAEAFNYLAAIRSAQERHLALKGSYASDPIDLDIQQEQPKYFTIAPVGTPGPIDVFNGSSAVPPDFRIVLQRDGTSSSYGTYTVIFTEQGFLPSNGLGGFDENFSTIPDSINPIAN